MSEFYDEMPDDRANPPDDDDSPLQYFCKLTFGQFFTIIVLLLITVCSTFYFGARYGNLYLRIDGLPADDSRGSHAAAVEITAPGRPSANTVPSGPTYDAVHDDELKEMARNALRKSEQERLEVVARKALTEQSAAAPTNAAGTPAYNNDVPAPEPTYPNNPPLNAPAPQPTVAPIPQPTSAAETELQHAPARATVSLPTHQKKSATDPNNIPDSVYEPPTDVPAPRAANKQVTRSMLGNIPQPTSAEETAPAAPVAPGLPYAVQVGAYQNIAEANAHAAQWKSKGYSAYVTSADLPDRGRWYRVRVGAFATRADASSYIED